MHIFLYLLEKRQGQNYNRLSSTKKYLSVTLHVICLASSILALLVSLFFFFLTTNSYFLVNSGCIVAVTMVIILIELFLRILLPLAGINLRT